MAGPDAKLEALCGPGPASIAWLGLPSPAVARIAGMAGFGACVIDREHGTIGIETAGEMTAALRAAGTAALVRVPELAPGAIKHALDAGASGIIVPYVESAAAAAAAVRAFYYPPAGSRGFAGPVIAATGYGADTGYAARWNATGLLAVQIESTAGLAAAPAIAAVEGVDLLFFGPFDYAQDIGIDPAADPAPLERAFGEVAAAARGAGLLAGVFPWPGASPASLGAMGADMIVHASDIAVLKAGFAAARG